MTAVRAWSGTAKPQEDRQHRLQLEALQFALGLSGVIPLIGMAMAKSVPHTQAGSLADGPRPSG